MNKKTPKAKIIHRQVKKTETKKPQDKEVSVRKVGLYNLKSPFGSHKKRKILGRGSGSGHGKTSTRGSKGQTSRTGRDFYLGFEGGQSPLIRRFPKRGFTSKFRKEFQIVNLLALKNIKEGVINPDLLEKKGFIRNKQKLVKVLAKGEIKNPVTIQAHAFSKKAQEKIVGAGGKAEVISGA